MRSILVATDGSEESLKVLEAAAELARQAEGTSLTLLTVGKPVYYSFDAGFASITPSLEILMPAMVAKKAVEKSAAVLRDKKIACRTLTAVGDPAKEICSLADRQGYDLVIMGKHRRGKLAEMVKGSVSSYVARHAHCPVLIAK